MPYQPEHRLATKTRIIRSARLLFNRHGFDAASIDDIMLTQDSRAAAFIATFVLRAVSMPKRLP